VTHGLWIQVGPYVVVLARDGSRVRLWLYGSVESGDLIRVRRTEVDG
jgi:hypothetical protein